VRVSVGPIFIVMHKEDHERVVVTLCEKEAFLAYKQRWDNQSVGMVPRILGAALVCLGNVFYGKEPSYGKFKAVEVIARIPYQSWEVASYMLLTFCYANEKRAIELSKTSVFGRVSQDNETMHVVVLSQLAKKYGEDGIFLHTLVPVFFAFFYFATSFVLYLVSPRAAFELNYLFEDHAYRQYERFLELRGKELAQRPVESDFLKFYGRLARTEHELFVSIRNDEIIHRNMSAAQAAECR
jgi:ubiquinol oxidase